jgi:DNA (cytosine-5)-methyltransferase 1
MKTISLFAGCGGMDLGAEAAGAEIVYANEINADACQTLARYFKRAKVDQCNVADVTSFPDADLVIGGYPCQSFSMGGNRAPEKDARTYLYLQFARCLSLVNPKFFVAENVVGLKRLQGGSFLDQQYEALGEAGEFGYRITVQEVDAKSYGVPQTRKRVLLVGVRRDLDRVFMFPKPTHGVPKKRTPFLKPYTSHGEAIKDLPLWPTGEFYERPHDPDGHWSWYYMSRNRKADWDGPAYTVVANWRHVTLHPASRVMTLTWSNLADGWKQRWDFSDDYEHTKVDSSRPTLAEPRRLSWRECARIQTFPDGYEPSGPVESKFTQIGNAVPPLLAEAIIRHLISGDGVVTHAIAESRSTIVLQKK